MRLNHQADIDQKDRAALVKDTQVQALITSTKAQRETWVDNNVTTLAGVRVALKLIFNMLVWLVRREISKS
jgi:hypothetical protein